MKQTGKMTKGESIHFVRVTGQQRCKKINVLYLFTY